MKARLFIYIALGADLLIAVSKFMAAIISGSSAMTSEGIHTDAIERITHTVQQEFPRIKQIFIEPVKNTPFSTRQ